MKWIVNLKNKIKAKIESYKIKSELYRSNAGRDFGWFVELDNQRIGELLYHGFDDMFWDRYKIVPYPAFEKEILDNKNWQQCEFKFLNKHYLQYADNAFSGSGKISKINEEFTISMRALYLVSIT